MDSITTLKLEKISKSLYKALELTAEFSDNDTDKAEPYIKIMEKLCVCEVENLAHSKAMVIGNEENSAENFQKIYNDEMKKKTSKPVDTKRYKDFAKYTKYVLEDRQKGARSTEDTEMDIQETVSEIDPFTKQPLEDPVRNNICKHVYEKSSIFEVIRLNSRVRCPILGCGNKQYIMVNHIEEDMDFKRILFIQRVNKNQ